MKINISGLKEMKDKLSNIKYNLNNIEDFKDIPFNLLSNKIETKFNLTPLTNTGGQINKYKSTKPLSSAYLKANKNRYNKQILNDTGELKYSFKYENPNNIAEVRRNEFIYGSKLDKAKMQRVKDLIEIDYELNREMQKYIGRGIMTNKELFKDVEGVLI